MNITYLSKRGYVIKKEYYDEAKIDKVKRELYVKPNIKNDFGQEPEQFPVYLENSKKLYVPKFYGMNKFGSPELNTLPEKLVHTPWNITTLETEIYNFKIGYNYPYPIVDIQKSRKFASETLWRMQKKSTVQEESKRILKQHTFNEKR